MCRGFLVTPIANTALPISFVDGRGTVSCRTRLVKKDLVAVDIDASV
jgi:hypothetical protein